MKTPNLPRCAALGLLALGLTAAGCEQNVSVVQKAPAARPAQPDAETPAASSAGKKVPVGKNVFLEILPGGKRRVLVNAYVCQQKALLEQLLTKKLTKEHEAVLAADMDARHIHAALIAAGAEPGSPVQYQPYRPARGTTIKVFVQYKDRSGKLVTLPAQKWVRHVKTRKDLEYDWVFAGSHLTPPPEPNLPPHYEANVGDVICVSNFDTALLDLPVASTAENDALEFEANTDRVPALGTPVTVILEPVLAKKK